MGIISKCTLISEEEKLELIKKWNKAKEERKMRDELRNKFDTLSFEQLEKILKIIEI